MHGSEVLSRELAPSFFLRPKQFPAHHEGGVTRCNLQRRGKKRDSGGVKSSQITRLARRLSGLVNLSPRRPYPDRLIEFCFLFVSGASSRDCGMSSHWHGWVISISEILVGTSILLLVVSLGQFFACVLRRGAENGSKGSDQKR
jgi:hypothetical protein